MILKLCAVGLRDYWLDLFNRFDALVVLTSAMDIMIDAMHLEIGIAVAAVA